MDQVDSINIVYQEKRVYQEKYRLANSVLDVCMKVNEKNDSIININDSIIGNYEKNEILYDNLYEEYDTKLKKCNKKGKVKNVTFISILAILAGLLIIK
jgi:hypothetical protein